MVLSHCGSSSHFLGDMDGHGWTLIHGMDKFVNIFPQWRYEVFSSTKCFCLLIIWYSCLRFLWSHARMLCCPSVANLGLIPKCLFHPKKICFIMLHHASSTTYCRCSPSSIGGILRYPEHCFGCHGFHHSPWLAPHQGSCIASIAINQFFGDTLVAADDMTCYAPAELPPGSYGEAKLNKSRL